MNLQNNQTDMSTLVIEGGDGMQLLTINPTVSSLYRFSVSIGNVAVAGTPSIIAVSPDSVQASSSTPQGIPSTAIAGSLVNLAVTSRDLYDNKIPGGSVHSFRAFFTGTQRFSRSLRREGESAVYRSAITMTIAGDYSLAVVLMNSQIKGSPFKMTVFASDVDPDACFASGSSIHAAVAAAPSSFLIHVRDRYLNYIRSASVLEGGFTATLSSWAIPDPSRPGLYIFNTECDRTLTCPPATKAAVLLAAAQNAALEETFGKDNYEKVPVQNAVRRVVVTSAGVLENAGAGNLVVNFIALMPGSYVLNVTYFGHPIAKVSGDPCTTKCTNAACTACPTVAPAPAPRVVNAVFENNGGQLAVNFLTDSDRADQRGLFDCNLLLTSDSISKLAGTGRSPQCTFCNPRSFVVHLAWGASLKVNQEISFSAPTTSSVEHDLTIGAGGLRSKIYCESPYSVEFVNLTAMPRLCYQVSKSVMGQVRVLRPANPVKPTAILKGPSLLSSCDKLTLDASSSYGSGGRQLTFELGLSPSSADDSLLRAFISTASHPPYTQKSWTFDSRLLLLGVPATFVVRAVNFLDESSLSELTVMKHDVTAPIIMIEGAHSRDVFSTLITRLRGDVVLSSCASEADKSVDFEWKLTKIAPDDLTMAVELDTVTRYTRSLYIAPGQLVAGHKYTFQLSGTMKTNTSNMGTEQVEINCQYAPLVAKLKGSDRAVNWGHMLTLDSSASLDLDGTPPPGAPVWSIDYRWKCFTVTGDPCLGPENPALLVNEPVVQLDTQVLSPGTYTFEVTLLKEPGPRTASAMVKIWITPNIAPQVAIRPVSVRKVNPGTRVLLQGEVTAAFEAHLMTEEELLATTTMDSPTAVITWTQVAGEHIMEYPAMLSIPPRFSSLAIRQGVLQCGQDYSFRLTVSDSRYPSLQGMSEIHFRVNTPPSSGQCMVSPLSGGYSNTIFSMLCKDWVDEVDDLPLNYEFRYMLPASVDPLDEIPLGTLDKNLFTTGLPAPPAGEPRHDVVVLIYVIDQSGGKSRTSSNTEVLEGSTGSSGGAGRRLLQVQGLARLDECVDTGNVECIIQLTIAVAESGGSGTLKCEDKKGMIDRLRSAAGKLRMNKVEVAGFATAIRQASVVACVSLTGSRRTMASSEMSTSLDLISMLVGTSQQVGLEDVAAKGMGHSLSTTLGSLEAINVARRSVRHVLDHYLQHAMFDANTSTSTSTSTRGRGTRRYTRTSREDSPFVRRDASDYIVDREWAPRDEQGGGWGGRRVLSNGRRSNSDTLLDTLTSLSESQLEGAVQGEDSAAIDTPLIKMQSKRSAPDSLDDADIAPTPGPNSPAFSLPNGVTNGVTSQSSRRSQDTGSTDAVDVQATAMGVSPFDSDRELGGGVASLSLGGMVVRDLQEPIILRMPGGRNGSSSYDQLPGRRGLIFADGEFVHDYDGKVDTCQFWNFAAEEWDAQGCIAIGTNSESGHLECECYHLTDFGGVASDAIPTMSMPDPTNPGAAFKSFNSEDITVVAVLGALLLTYWALMYWGWQKDREDSRQTQQGLLSQDPNFFRKRKEQESADELDSAINANNAELTKRLMRGSFVHQLMQLRHRLFSAISTKHKLLGGFFAVNSNYTRPRRFTVLFCMLVGNMYVNALWIGSGTQETFIQKALSGVISAFIMFPVSFFFAWIFKNLEISPYRQKIRDERIAGAKAYAVQRVVDALGHGGQAQGPNGNVIAAPSSLVTRRPPRRKNWIPAPDFQRIGRGANTPTTDGEGKSTYKRMPLSSPMMNSSITSGQDSTLPSPGMSDRDTTNTRLALGHVDEAAISHVGMMIQRRSLPMHKGPRRPAPVPVHTLTSLSQRSARDSKVLSGSSSDDEDMQSLYDGSILSSPSGATSSPMGQRGKHVDGSGSGHSSGTKTSRAVLALPHQDMQDGADSPGTRIDYTTRQVGTGRTLDKKTPAKVGLSHKLAAKAIQNVMAPKKKFDQPKTLIDYRFQYLAYFLAVIWYTVRLFLCMIYTRAYIYIYIYIYVIYTRIYIYIDACMHTYIYM